MTWYEYKELVNGIIKERGTELKVKSLERGKVLGRATKVHEIGDSMYIDITTSCSFETYSVHDIISYVTEGGVETAFPRHKQQQQTLW